MQSVTLHTDVGDIKIELFCEQCPKTCENFLALSASGYYDGNLFHRNIKVSFCLFFSFLNWLHRYFTFIYLFFFKGFMVQTGDPSGTGKGGQSIWGKHFEDEVRDDLKVIMLCVIYNFFSFSFY